MPGFIFMLTGASENEATCSDAVIICVLTCVRGNARWRPLTSTAMTEGRRSTYRTVWHPYWHRSRPERRAGRAFVQGRRGEGARFTAASILIDHWAEAFLCPAKRSWYCHQGGNSYDAVCDYFIALFCCWEGIKQRFTSHQRLTRQIWIQNTELF